MLTAQLTNCPAPHSAFFTHTQVATRCRCPSRTSCPSPAAWPVTCWISAQCQTPCYPQSSPQCYPMSPPPPAGCFCITDPPPSCSFTPPPPPKNTSPTGSHQVQVPLEDTLSLASSLVCHLLDHRPVSDPMLPPMLTPMLAPMSPRPPGCFNHRIADPRHSCSISLHPRNPVRA
jgi:hypothetical protein